ncbi:metallophosphoesterase family protein [Sorangium sp. So ce128]|uniref:metallophosphoesterase family protein n=1 Tax=Sorangium sp. So ce128 TaxID=3133281 RepID=UPI003F5EAA8E
MTTAVEDDIVLKLLHTADWHLGRSFPRFSADQRTKLTRARLEALDRILLAAERLAVDAVLCAGDLFDEPCPAQMWWEEVATCLQKRKWKNRPLFLLPGNHDPLVTESVWAKEHKFRTLLPEWAHVVDREGFEFTLPNNAVLYAVPCFSKAGQRDPTEAIPTRAPGDDRIRIGMVHGSTFDAKDYQTNFPIAVDAALKRGLDYLALGDTHGFRFVPPDRKQPPTIYPGAPEPTAFDEKEPGYVAVVFINRQRRATVNRERVARWTWEEKDVTTMDSLRELARRSDLGDRVFRLRVDMRVPIREYEEAERILEDLEGTPARHGRVGVLALDRQGLELETSAIESDCSDIPDVLRSAIRRLQKVATETDKRPTAERALYHLYRLSRKKPS